MNIFGLSGLLVGISSISMSAFLFLKGRGKKINIIWAVYSFCVAIWGFGGLKIATISDNPSKAFLWWQITYTGIIFLPVLFYHFVSAFLNIKRRFFIAAIYIAAFVFLFFNYTSKELFIGSVKLMFSQFYWVNPPGPRGQRPFPGRSPGGSPSA